MVISVEVEGIEGLTWGDMWPRHAQFGECEGWCGSGLIVVVTRAFTPDEDLLFDWVERQDKAHLYGVHHLPDGRDLIVFERQWVKQSQEDAVAEHMDHLRLVLRKLGLSALSFTL